MRRSLPHLSASAAALAAVLALALPGAAQEPRATGAQEQEAQSLFLEGRTALEKGDHATACAKFNRSLALVQRPGTLLNLAQCEERLGKLVSAAKHWQDGIAMLPPGDERLAPSQQRAAALAPRLAHLAVTVAPPAPAARVEVDGAAVPLDTLAAGVAVDPGRHTVALLVAGSPDQRSTVDLVEGQIKIVALSALVPQAPGPVPPGPSVAAAGGGGSSLRIAGFAVLGVGIAGAIAAAVTGGILVSKHAQITSDCPGMACTPAGRSLINGVGPLNVGNGVAWGVALAGVAGGVVLVIVGGKTPTSIAPVPLSGGGGLWMTMRF